MNYTVSELYAGANDGWYEVQGLKVPLLNSAVMIDIGCPQTDPSAADAMKKALHGLRSEDNRIKDGDWFETPVGKFMAQSPSVLTEDEANGRAAKIAAQQQPQAQQAQAQQPTQQAAGVNPNTVNLPQTVTFNVEVAIPAPSSGSAALSISVPKGLAHYNNYIVDQIDKELAKHGASIRGAHNYGNVLNVIDFPNGDKTMLVGYDNDSVKVVIEIKQ